MYKRFIILAIVQIAIGKNALSD